MEKMRKEIRGEENWSQLMSIPAPNQIGSRAPSRETLP